MRWYLALFTSTNEADAIVGDLHEERRAIARRDGEWSARRWYCRQVLGTVGALAIEPARRSPLTFAVVGVAGVALVLPLNLATSWLAGQFVARVPMYQYVPATVFWGAASTLPYLVVGTVCAAAMGPRAMSSALAVLASMAAWVGVVDPLVLAIPLPLRALPGPRAYLAQVLPWLVLHGLVLLSATAIGVTLRHRRSQP